MATASARALDDDDEPERSHELYQHESDEDVEALACKLVEGKFVDMTKSDREKQLNKVKESEGFESDAYSLSEDGWFLGPRRLHPKILDRERARLKEHCQFAIQSYNTEHGTELKLVKVVQANHQIDFKQLGEEFYITFTAQEVECGVKSLYQAKVLEPFSYPSDSDGGQLKVFICRPKPSSS